MTTLPVSGKGLTLLGAPGSNTDNDVSKAGGKVQQAMRLDLEEGVLQNILRSARSGGKGVHVSFGKTITLNFGNRSKQLTASTQASPTELYSYDSEAHNELTFAALQSHRLALKKAQDNTLGADAALTKLQMSLASHEKEKQSRQIQLAEGANLPPALSAQLPKTSAMKKHPQSQRLMNGSAHSMPGSPSHGATRSPHISAAPTSAPPVEDGKALKAKAIRIPLIHFLAVRPVSEKYLAQTLSCSEGECKEVLERVGRPYRLDNSKWDLTDKAYRDLDVHRFKYPSEDDRQLAIDRAVTAFDRMRLSHADSLWQKLLPVHERGRGKVISKLNLREGPKAQKATTPRINVQATEDTAPGELTTTNDSDTRLDRLAPTDAEPMARSNSTDSVKKPKGSDKEVKKILSKSPVKPSKVQKLKEKLPPKLTADAKKGAKKGAPAKVVAKSSEFVRDSDEDEDQDMTDASNLATMSSAPKTAATGVKKPPAPPNPAKPLPLDSSKKSSNTEDAKDQKKPDSSKVEDVGDTKKSNPGKLKDAKDVKKPILGNFQGVKDHKKPSTTQYQSAEKRPPASSSSSSESKHRSSDSSQTSVAMSKTLSRQRTTSSPHKPSPLGSSPPANASDLENDGRALSSASSTSTPLIAQSRSKNQTASKPRTSAAANGSKPVENTSERSLKRKADDIDSNIHNHSVSLTNGVVNGDTTGVKRYKASPMSPPTSDSSNGSSSDAKYKQAVEEAQRFKRYYAKYHELYQEVATLPKDVMNPKFDSLMKMHEKLKKMKEDIAKASIL